MSIENQKLKNIIEAALMAVAKPMNLEQLMKLFSDEERPSVSKIKQALTELQNECEGRGVELREVASGFRYQARQDYAEWLGRLWEEKPAKYSRAYLETLALIAYRQPVTRGEIEEVRGVGVSSNIIKTMLEREWIRVVGHRDVPGRPSLYATTRQFLDYFNMKSLDELPSLAEIRDLDDLNPELGLTEPGSEDDNEDGTSSESGESSEGGGSRESNDKDNSQVDEAVLQDETEIEYQIEMESHVENDKEMDSELLQESETLTVVDDISDEAETSDEREFESSVEYLESAEMIEGKIVKDENDETKV